MGVVNMMQGDKYALKFEITKADGTVITSDDVSDLEITVGHITKNYSSGEVIYSDGLWCFPVFQEESFALPAKQTKVQVRVKWTDGSVEGTSTDNMTVDGSESKEVL